MIRRHSEVVSDMPAARAVATEAITEAAWRKNEPADLINVALEKLVEGSFELPGYSTLDDMAGRIREEVNSSIFAMVADRLGPAGVTLLTGGPGTKSDFNRLKKDRATSVVDELPSADRAPALGRHLRRLPRLVAGRGPAEDHRFRG